MDPYTATPTQVLVYLEVVFDTLSRLQERIETQESLRIELKQMLPPLERAIVLLEGE